MATMFASNLTVTFALSDSSCLSLFTAPVSKFPLIAQEIILMMTPYSGLELVLSQISAVGVLLFLFQNFLYCLHKAEVLEGK